MKVTSSLLPYLLSISALCSLCLPSHSHALVLNGTGTATQLTGTLGTVDVVSIDDVPAGLTGYLTSGGLINPAPLVPIKRVQYDLLNNAGNGSIFSYRVDYPVGTTVIGAGNPGKFIDSAGVTQNYWTGSNFGMLFDSGFGVYAYDLAFGSEWEIDYAADHVSWIHTGNGFFPATATGRTDLGNAIPTFSLFFDPATPLGLQLAQADGRSVTGAPVVATGQVLSAVPEPTSLAMASLVGLAILLPRRRHSR